MTQPGDKSPSTFTTRADNAALALRKNLQGQGRQVSDSSPVTVGPDGKPPAPLPPEGSYIRQAIELQRRAAEEQKIVGDQPAVGTANQAMDGSMAPKLPQAPTPQQTPSENSPRAEQRISELVAQLRAKEQELQQAAEASRKYGETAQQLQQRLQDLETQHQSMMQANLDNLDPDTRMQVMQDTRLAQRLNEFEQRILGRIQPQLKNLESQAARNEMQALSDTYPSFDYQIHGPLIDMFRAKNGNCTVEQAFRAIAEPDELVTRAAASAMAVPPIVPPGSGELASARYAPQPVAPAPSPQEELVDESRRIAELRRSLDPKQQKEGMMLLDRHLRRRLGG